MAEAQGRLEPLHQSEDVAFGVAGRIPPAASGVADDQDFAFASPVLQAEFRALLPIQFPWRRRSLQHHGAMHLVAQFLDFGVMSGHVRSSRFKRRSWARWPWDCLRPCPARRPRGGRAARARGTRGSLRRTLAARPAPAVAIPLSFTFHAKARRRRREQEIRSMSRGSTSGGRQRSGAMTRVRARRSISPLGQAVDIGALTNEWKARACLRAHSELTLTLAVGGRSPAPITIDSDPESDRPN